MDIGMTKQELDDLLALGKSEAEIGSQLKSFADEAGQFSKVSLLLLLLNKISVGISENNKRIAEQLSASGIKPS